MPTAGEYRHEPSGIPCHCYVRRRLHHTPCRKSCLRKNSDTPSQHNDSKTKRVTFNPTLSVRSYDSQASPEPSRKYNARESASKDHARSRKSNTICDKLTSFFGLNHCKPSDKRDPKPSSYQKGLKDYNNNIVDCSGDMNMERSCPICESKRNQSPVRGPRYGRARERTPSPCGFHQPYPARVTKNTRIELPQYQGYAAPSFEYNPTNYHRTPTPYPGRYHSPRRLFRRDSSGTESSETQFRSLDDGSVGYENMDTLNYLANKVVRVGNDIQGTVDIGKPSAFVGVKPDQRYQPISIPLTINDHGEEDKLDEYIYEIPINNNDKDEREYEYISVKSLTRRHSQTEGYSGKTAPPNHDAILVKHKTESDLTSETYHPRASRLNTASPQSAPDPQTIITCPYDIKFLNQRGKPSSTDTSEEEIEVCAESAVSVDNADGTDPGFMRRQRIKQFSPLADILWMTPVALFWTGCAFLIAMICAFLFPCDHC